MRSSAAVATFIVLDLCVAAAACGSSSSLQTSSGTTGTGSSTSSSSGASSASTSSSSGATTSSSSASSSSGAGGAGGGGTGDGGGIDIDGGPVGNFPFPPVKNPGGPIVAAPKVVTVTFLGDPMATQVADLGASIASSSYWDAIRAGYCGSGGACIGDGPAGTAVALNTAAAASYTDSTQGGTSSIHTFLSGLISGNLVPAPDANTIYALYFPEKTTVSLDGAPSCQDFDGYHSSLMMGGQEVFYAIINECSSLPPLSTLQNTTITASHEIIETATDPSSGAGSYYLDLNDQTTFGWDDVQGGEVGDLCVDPFGLGLDSATEGGFTVQRSWSAANAAAGKNPCVPVPAGEVYFNAFPLVSAVVLDVGKSATIEVDALADGPMADWTVSPQDWTDYYGKTTYLTFAIKGGTAGMSGPQIQVKSGDKIQLTVTLTANPDSAIYGEADAVIVSSNGDPSTATAAHFWPFIVVTPLEASQGGITMMKRHGARPNRHAHGRAPSRRSCLPSTQLCRARVDNPTAVNCSTERYPCRFGPVA